MTQYAKYDHAGWLRRTLDRPLSRTEAKVAEIIGLSYGGIYNAPIAFKRHWRPFLGGRAVEIVARSNRLSTFDFDGLTKLVLLSHEARIRFEISIHTWSYFKLAFSQRSAAGGMSQRHPNIDEAVAALRAWLPADHAVIFRPEDADREHSEVPAPVSRSPEGEGR